MSYIFRLCYVVPKEDDHKHTLTIGYYSSMKIVNAVIDKYKLITGFNKFGNQFLVEKMLIDYSEYAENLEATERFLYYFESEKFEDNQSELDSDDYDYYLDNESDYIYELSHEYYDGEKYDYKTFLGAYSDEKRMEEVFQKVKIIERFQQYPDGF